jgi:hypothetical protein
LAEVVEACRRAEEGFGTCVHGRIEMGAAGNCDVGEGEYLKVEAAVVYLAYLFGSEGGGGDYRVHEVAVVEALEGIDDGIIHLNGSGDGVQEGAK